MESSRALQDRSAHPKIAQFLDLKEWNKIQDLFSDVIGVSIYTVDKKGNLLTRPSRVSHLCDELRRSSLFCVKKCIECVQSNIETFLQTQKVDIPCLCGFHNFIIPIVIEDTEIIGFLIAGPVILGGRKKKEDYVELCRRIGIDIDLYFDSLHEVKEFSYKSVNSVIHLLGDAVNYMIKIGYQRIRLETWLPGFLNLAPANNRAYSELYLNKLLNSLLDIAIELTRAHSGSVMICDRSRGDCQVSISRGLKIDFAQYDKHSALRIAQIVVNEKKGFLINESLDNARIKPHLKRPEIKSSIIVPIRIDNKVFGAFSVNSHSDTVRFNKRTLAILNQLGNMTGVALTQFNVDEFAADPS
jgi:ligand-binding sensor protein